MLDKEGTEKVNMIGMCARDMYHAGLENDRNITAMMRLHARNIESFTETDSQEDIAMKKSSAAALHLYSKPCIA